MASNTEEIKQTDSITNSEITISTFPSNSQGSSSIAQTLPHNDLLSEEMWYSEDSMHSSDWAKVMKKVPHTSSKIQSVPEKKLAELYISQSGPYIYDVPLSLTSKPTVVNKLPEIFCVLPIDGKPAESEDVDQYYDKKILDFLNIGLSDDEAKKIKDYCSPEWLKTGKEVILPTNVPITTFAPFNPDEIKKSMNPMIQPDSNLFINKKYKQNMKDNTLYTKHLKYRGVKLLPLPNEHGTDSKSSKLQPGKDMLFQVRLYRPFPYNQAKLQRVRHSVCISDIMLYGSQPLTMLRDRIICTNDLDMRVDVSNNIDEQPLTTAKDIFPSGFFFINNVFYVDTRPGCKDLTAVIRQWAESRGLGKFPHKDMCSVSFQDLVLRLGHPEVYVHQGKCEHIFTFSDIRLVNNDDVLRKSLYPFNTVLCTIQSVYCATCAEFCAKWVITDTNRVPFDPAYFCDTCLKMYMYKDGKKIGDFKAYSFKGNDVHLIKPSNNPGV